MTTQFLVKKDQLATTKIVELQDAALDADQVRMRIDRFALTSNNITYAAFGNVMNYWQFFPSNEDGFGIIPVWGFGTVVESAHPDVPVGERFYGYYPMANSVVLSPAKARPSGFADGASHRANLHAVYNQYVNCATDSFNADPFYDKAAANTEDIQALLRPLFITSWLIDDFFAGNASLRRSIHAGFENLQYSCSIGGTHVDNLGSSKDLTGVKPVLFFAPAQVKRRSEEWGGAEFGKRMAAAWQGFTKTVTYSQPAWLKSQYQQGLQATATVYAQVLAGKGDPRIGQMLSL